MSWFPDMGREAMVAAGDHVRAVGWLHPDHPFPRGEVSPEFVAKFKAFARCGGHCAGELYWGIAMGFHTCELCGNAHGVRNLGVPAGNLLFVAPEMVAHYVEEHGYAPPAEFITAVLASPLPGTPEYTASVAGFRRIHQRQAEEMA